MQDYETTEDSSVLDERSDRIMSLLKSLLKKLVVFICFGPGVLGVLWLIGRIFKR